jgi:soluble lytic murein transglycosylase-like protein
MTKLLVAILCALPLLGLSNSAPEEEADPPLIAAWVQSKNPRLTQGEVASIVLAVESASEHFYVDPLLILGMIQKESGFRPKVKSDYGAVGLMQVVPRLHKAKFKGSDPTDISANIHAGAWVLRDCQLRHMHNMRKSLACYSGHSNDGVALYKSLVLAFRSELLNFINQGRP